jgi:hypothetical protein
MVRSRHCHGRYLRPSELHVRPARDRLLPGL